MFTRTSKGRYGTVVLQAAAVGAMAVALSAWQASGYGWPFWLWVLSGIAVWASLPRARATQGVEPLSAATVIGLAGVLVIALVLRLPGIREIPANVSVDELLPALDAMQIAAGEAPNVFSSLGWFTIPRLSFAIPAVVMLWLPGDTFYALRLSSLLTGLAGIAATFLLARRLFGNTVALSAAFFMAAGFWHLHNSRTGFPFVQTSFAVPAVLYLLVRAQQTQSTAVMAAAGAAFGLALQLYFPVRILVVLVPMFLVVGWIGNRQSVQRCLGEVGALAGGALFSLLPLITSVAPEALLGRSQGVLLTNPAVFAERARIYQVESWTAVVWGNLRESIGMFIDWADVCILNRSPDGLLDPFTLAAFVLGALAALSRLHVRALMLVVWIGVVFIFGVALSDAPRASYRLGPAMPAFYILAAYGFHACILERQRGPRIYRSLVIAMMMIGFAAAIVQWNYDTFFVEYSRKGQGQAMPHAAAMRFAGERCDGREIYFVARPEPLGSDQVPAVFCPQHRGIAIEDVPRRVEPNAAATFIVLPWQGGSLPRLRKCYPNAIVQEHHDRSRRPLFTSVDVTLEGVGEGHRHCPLPADPSQETVPNILRRDSPLFGGAVTPG